jgi:triacylglycerol lipase
MSRTSTQPIPVVLVHGFLDTSRIFKKMAASLRKQNFIVYDTLNLKPSTGKNGIEPLAEQLEKYIHENVGKEKPFHLVGFSMGGIVVRFYLQKMNGNVYAQKLITLASPHHGSWWAWLLNIKSCQQVRPNSEFLNSLNSDFSMLKHIQFTSIWAEYDTH